MTQQPTRTSKQRELVFDGLVYGLGATLSELARSAEGQRLAEDLHKTIGGYLAEYLTRHGTVYDTGATPDDTVRNIVAAFTDQLDFAALEGTESTPDQGVHGSWRSILGLSAYAELAARYPDPFLGCPLNAVIRYELDKAGHTLTVHGARAHVSEDLLESWEEVRPGRSFLAEDDDAPASR